MPERDPSALIQTCVDSNVLLFGTFTLKSGRQSPYFFNAGLLHQGSQLSCLAQHFSQALHESGIEFDVIFGPAYKGISLAAITVARLSTDYNKEVGFAYDRKEVKEHGEGGTHVGAPLKRKRVIILDDVVSLPSYLRSSYV